MDALERLIVENRKRMLPEVHPRDASLAEVPGMASVLIGIRRSGKTFRLYQRMQTLLEAGVPLNRILFINFEDDRLYPLREGLLNDLLEAFYRLAPEARSEEAYLFLDEIQAVEGWSRFTRRVLDTENAKLFITGSSAKLLSSEVATGFRGRGCSTELLPLSFHEALVFAGTSAPESLPGPGERSALESALRKYLLIGGFPAVQTIEENLRFQVLQDYIELVLLRDIIDRHQIKNAHAARNFAITLLQCTGGRMSVHKTHNDLRSRGISIGKDSLYSLLDHFTDAFLLFTVPIFSDSARVRQSNPRKIYAVDPGLAYSVAPAASMNLGARLENAVYLELRRRTGVHRPGSICYYITASGFEVDFAVGDPDMGTARSLVQVCADLSDKTTLTREVRALTEAMKEMNLMEAEIVTLNSSEEITTEHGLIRVVQAWAWLLNLH
jgi:predicted AAA+ superfamily ATPase